MDKRQIRVNCLYLLKKSLNAAEPVSNNIQTFDPKTANETIKQRWFNTFHSGGKILKAEESD